MISDYIIFQAKLFPVLPILFYQAIKVRKDHPTPSAFSEQLAFGNGEKKILILGESTAAGVGATHSKFTLASQLSRRFGPDYEILNLGKNGLRTGQALTHFGDKILSQTNSFEGVFIFLGANDCFRLTHPHQFKKQLNLLISRLQSQLKPNWIYLADIPPVHLFPAFPALLRFYLKCQRSFLQREMIVQYTDNERIIFDPLELSFNQDFFAIDGIHPSDLGYQKIAEFAFEGLKARLLI